MEALIITLREGIEAALVVGIVLAYLKKTGKEGLNRFVYVGLGLAALASLAVAALFQILGIDPENEYMEGAMLGVGGIFVASMVVWMWKTAASIKAHMESRLDTVLGGRTQGTGRAAFGLLLFTFFMVFREGVETVIFLAVTTLGELNLIGLVGGMVGIGLAVLFGFLFVRGSLRINLSRFFAVTSIVLLILAAKLIAGSVHEFAEVQLIPMSKEIMALLGYFVRDESSAIILMALLVIPIIMILMSAGERKEVLAPAASGAERRKAMAAAVQGRLWRGALAVSTLVVLVAMTSAVFAGAKFYDPTPVAVTASADEVRIPLSTLEEGRLHKFLHSVQGVDVRFLVFKDKDSAIATAFDACQICGAVGYMQEGRNAICKNCNAPIPMETIAQGGGCNPLPLEAKIQDQNLVVAVAQLKQEMARFR